MTLPQKVKNRTERLERLKTRQKVMDIIRAVLSGKFYSAKRPMDELFNQNTPRMEYISPAERGSYNYGYMEGKEMYGTPNMDENLRF